MSLNDATMTAAIKIYKDVDEYSRWAAVPLRVPQTQSLQSHLVSFKPLSNSSHVFDSLNMFVRPENPSLLRSSGIRSLPRDGTYLSNHSEIANSRYFHPAGNLSGTIKLS